MISGVMVCMGTGCRCIVRGSVEWRWCKTGDEDWRRKWEGEAPEMLQYVMGGVDLRLTGSKRTVRSLAALPCARINTAATLLLQ